MAGLSATQLLDLSERGREAGAASRAVMFITAAFPERTRESVEALSLSQCDRILASIRSETFGPVLRAQHTCNACNQPFELSLDLSAHADAAGEDPATKPEAPPSRAIRALTLGDLAAIEQQRDPGTALALLAKRVAADERADSLDLQALSEALERADPNANLEVETACPDCAQRQLLLIDLASYLWEEIAHRAPRIMRDVAELARIYHWSERDILAMSSQRRAFYLSAAQ